MKTLFVRALDITGIVLTLALGAMALYWLFNTPLWASIPLGLIVTYKISDLNPLSLLAHFIIDRDPELQKAIYHRDDDNQQPPSPFGTL